MEKRERNFYITLVLTISEEYALKDNEKVHKNTHVPIRCREKGV